MMKRLPTARRRSLAAVLSLLAGFSAIGPLRAAGLPGSLYVCDSNGDRVVRFTDLDGSGFVEPEVFGEILVYYDDASPGPDLSTPTHMARGPSDSFLLLDGGTKDAVLALRDSNGDGDANDEGEVWVFYDASAGGPKLSTPNTLVRRADGSYAIADDGSATQRILEIRDLNGDGDALDTDENRILYDSTALSVPLITDMEALAAGSDGRLYVADNTLGGVFVLADGNHDGDYLDEGEQTLFYQSGGDLVLTNVDSLALEGTGAVLACDNDTGTVVRLADANSDGDAQDPGEAQVFVGAGAAVAFKTITDILLLEDGDLVLLDNSKDGVVVAHDANADGSALDADETYRWILDGGATLSTPSGMVLGPPVTAPPVARFIRADASGDGRIDISDPVTTLGYLFLGRTLDACPDALDSDDGGEVNISDAVYTLMFLFGGGSPPPPPFPDEGPDPTADGLDCQVR
jgi:hypothetical protein